MTSYNIYYVYYKSKVKKILGKYCICRKNMIKLKSVKDKNQAKSKVYITKIIYKRKMVMAGNHLNNGM